jgi:hypothetical protein
MAAVYKTLSGNDSHEKEPGEKKNKQRVLILVPLTACEQFALVLMLLVEFKRCHVPPSPSAAGSLLADVSASEPFHQCCAD